MVFFIGYAVLLWVLIYCFRRRWQCAIILLAGVAIVPVTIHLIVELFEQPDRPLSWLSVVGDSYAAALFAIGAFIALVAKRRPKSACRMCDYDLRGLEADLCPECGFQISSQQQRLIHASA